MGILVTKGDLDGPAKVRSFFQIAIGASDTRAIGDVADTIIHSGVDLPELRIPSAHPMASVAERIFKERGVTGTRLVTV
ncbi:MAG: hypothetical protein EBQ96_08110 [Proteobacteria bacterium]|nr:hypothetical protein [Pseudomonadota bacterium]